MDLIPKPEQVVSAAGNVFHKLLYGGVADLRLMPRTLIDEGEHRELYHYRPQKGVQNDGPPILLVPPLAAPALCYDLRRGCSLVEHLVQRGHSTYLVDYGQISFSSRNMGIEHWVQDVVPEAIRAVHVHSGNRPVQVVGWSLGGIFAILTAADQHDLPIASITVVGSPFDVREVPLVAPFRPLLKYDGGLFTQAYRVLGGAPKPLVRRAFKLSSGSKMITKPLAQLTNLDDTEFLAQIEAVDRFTKNMVAYPGRSFGQLYHRMVKQNDLVKGKLQLSDHEVDVTDIRLPVLIFAGNTDGIAPIKAVKALVPLLKKAKEVRFEIVPGGHLGMLTGRASRTTTWVVMDEWFEKYSSNELPPARPVKKPAATKAKAKKAPPKKSATKKAAPMKSATKKAAPKKSSGQASTAKIGSNPERRFSSSASRELGAAKPAKSD
ncbi:MAG: alpha/beta fold hydrolase [Marmoricola sp.]